MLSVQVLHLYLKILIVERKAWMQRYIYSSNQSNSLTVEFPVGLPTHG